MEGDGGPGLCKGLRCGSAGRVAQLARALPLQGRGPWFESRRAHGWEFEKGDERRFGSGNLLLMRSGAGGARFS